MCINNILQGDCQNVLKTIQEDYIDLVYLDPPFYTQRTHKLQNRDNSKEYSFDDKFDSVDEYISMMRNSLRECRRVLKSTGSLFLHCDKTASHHLRLLLDEIFGSENFQSEIIWTYKRWSNSKKGLLNSHQVIFFYSKTKDFKFNTLYTDYSSTTNIDQILQQRERSKSGKSVYKKDETGNSIMGKEKKGVPLSDVWDIPYLNPKAKERTGYPTQKPVLLLNRIVEIATNRGDIILDPFCGSGTTCVSAKHLNRNYIGIDKSNDAILLSKERLSNMIITNSALLTKGAESYIEKTEDELSILSSLGAYPVQRNSGIDGFLKEYYNEVPVPVLIQKKGETLQESTNRLKKATQGKKYRLKIVIQTSLSESNMLFSDKSDDIRIVKSLSLQVQNKVETFE